MIIVEAPNLKAKLNNGTVCYYVEQDSRYIDECQGFITCHLGRLSLDDNNQLIKNPVEFKKRIGEDKLNQFLSKFNIGDKKLINGQVHELVAIDIHLHENDFDKRVNTTKFVADLFFKISGDNNDYRYL
jgi:hypothetical protein